MRVVGTIEARMGSSRLPGKTLSEVYGGMHLLDCVVHRFQMASKVNEVVVATTVEHGDDVIARWCEMNAVPLFRGSENDVLDRVASAALRYGADVVVQMGADSAYLDFELIDQLVGMYANGDYDFVCNTLELTYPLGIYGHIVRADTLFDVNKRQDLTIQERSDVTRFIWEHPEIYRLLNVSAPAPFRHPELRLTVDYPEDVEQAREVYRHFGGYRFTTAQVLELYRDNPGLFAKTRELAQHSAPHLKKRQ